MTPIPVPLRIGALVRQLRKDQGFTQGDLARRSGLTRACISQLERDNRTGHIRTLRDVLEVLGYELVAQPKQNSEDIAA